MAKKKQIRKGETVTVLNGLHKGAIGDVIDLQGVTLLIKLRPRPGFVHVRTLQLMPSSVKRITETAP